MAECGVQSARRTTAAIGYGRERCDLRAYQCYVSAVIQLVGLLVVACALAS